MKTTLPFFTSFYWVFGILLVSHSLMAQSLQPVRITDAHIHNGFTREGEKIVPDYSEYFTERGVTDFFFLLPVERSNTDSLFIRVIKEVAGLKDLEEQSRLFHLNTTISEEKLSDKPNVFLGIEYFRGVFGGNPALVEKYYNLGIRYITIINREPDKFFEEGRLTLFGQKILDEMSRVGMFADISHLREDQMLELIGYSKTPVISTHSGAKSITAIEGNLSNTVLEALKRNKGYVMNTFNKQDLLGDASGAKDGIKMLADHIEHHIKYLGVEHVGIGSDYQSRGDYVPDALNKKDTYHNIISELKRRGYTESDIDKIMGVNILTAIGFKKN